MDLDKLFPAPKDPAFSIDTEKLGHIDFEHLKGRHEVELRKIESDTLSSSCFVNALIKEIGSKTDGAKLGDQDILELTEAERETFADRFLEQNSYFYLKRITTEKVDENGTTVTSFEDGGVKYPREEGESSIQYLYRVWQEHNKELEEELKQLLEPYKDILKSHESLFNPNFTRAFEQVLGSADRLSKMVGQNQELFKKLNIQANPNLIKQLKIPEYTAIHSIKAWTPPQLPDMSKDLYKIASPIKDTNNKLDTLVETMATMQSLGLEAVKSIGSLNKAASELLIQFGVAADLSDRATRQALETARKTLWVAIVALVVSVIAFFGNILYTEWHSKKENEQTQAVLTEITQRIKTIDDSSQQDVSQTEQLIKAISALTIELRSQRNSDNATVPAPQ